MELDPRLRYQTPGEMLADLTAVEQRLQSSEDADLSSIPSSNAGGTQPIVMLVESSPRLQDTLRTKLSIAATACSLTGDPQTAPRNGSPRA